MAGVQTRPQDFALGSPRTEFSPLAPHLRAAMPRHDYCVQGRRFPIRPPWKFTETVVPQM